MKSELNIFPSSYVSSSMPYTAVHTFLEFLQQECDKWKEDLEILILVHVFDHMSMDEGGFPTLNKIRKLILLTDDHTTLCGYS